mgnify:CR=1 FL=1
MRLIITISIICFFSCDYDIKEKNKVNKSNLEFEYKAFETDIKDFYTITARIFNDKTDTVYFISSTCNGEADLIEFNTNQCLLMNQVSCYVNSPIILSIPPRSHHRFGKIRLKKLSETVKLGFNFYEVNKYFKLSTNSLAENLTMTDVEKSIIWAKEKRL